MTLLFVDGFDHYATADISKKWTSVGAGAAIELSNGRRGGGCLNFASIASTQFITKTLSQSASWVIGLAFQYYGTFTGSAGRIVSILDAGTSQCELWVNSDGTLSVMRNGTAVTNGTSVISLSISTYYYLEFKVTIADSISAGSCKVRVNGADVITVATGQDLKNTANAYANQIRLGPTSSAAGTPFRADDFYVCDQSGSTNNDFLGDARIDTLYPTSDGNYSQFAPSTGTDHFALVDEATPNTTDYNDGSTVGNYDSYGLGNLAALVSQSVYAVQVNAAVLKDDAGAKSAATMVRSGTTDADGTSAALGTSLSYVSQVFETNPDGSVAWTETSVNAMEAGIKVTA